jgi:predicted alpha/beta hydrolase family esterase
MVIAPGNAVILHGCPSRDEFYDPSVASPSNHHWLPWLAKQLIVRDIHAHTPEMPLAFAPDYPVWCREFERYDVTPQTVLVGHSCGAGFLVRWLSERPEVSVGRVVLVAPWVDAGRKLESGFFDFTVDPRLVARTQGVTIFNSDDDFQDIQDSVQLLRSQVASIRYREFHGLGHFTLESMGGAAFPELLAALTEA